MNLNVEQGAIEKPFVPVIRYSTPIIGADGKAIAVFVLNIYAQTILDTIEAKSQEDNEKGMRYFLINKKGDYLYHKQKSKLWKDQLHHSASFNEEYFNAKTYFKDENSGSLVLNGSIYSFHKVHPLAQHHQEYWYIVSSVDEKIALTRLDEFKSMFMIVLLLVVLLSFFIVRFFILKITDPLSLVTAQLRALSHGEIQKENIQYASNDEIGKIIKSTSTVVNAIEKTIHQANLVASGDLSREVKLLSENDTLGIAINSMTTRLREIEALAINLSQGNYESHIVAKSSDDKLGLALLDMIEYLEAITKLAESIAKGEIDISYKAVGHEDRLGIAMLKMISYLKTILNQANAITKEDFSQTIKAKSKDDELAIAMVSMTEMLSNNSTRNKEELYFNEGIGLFTDKLIGVGEQEALCKISISTLSRYVDGCSGLIYLYDKKKNALAFMASFALDGDVSSLVELGEKILGQVGLEKEPLLIEDIQNDKRETTSVFTFPLVHEGVLFGVVEIVSYSKFTKIHIDYLLKAAGLLATSLHLSEQNTQIKTLLEKSQAAYEELQTQSEELQESNIQMEEQQQQLTLQSSELRGKNETLALAKEEIDKRAEELEKASQYKSEFLANMSHELRTPLNSIILLSKLLSKNQDENLNKKDIEKANVINKSGNDLLFLINDILDLTKIESGNMELDITKVYSCDIIEEMQGLFGSLAEEKGIDFVLEDTFNQDFLSDRSKLLQVTKNLLSNAIKFTKEGSVSFSLEKKEENLVIIVKDTGIGIAGDKLGTIFEAFKQVDGSISRDFGGTGLGLSISKTIVALMDGNICVESELGVGTSFIVTLPFEQLQVNEESATKEDEQLKEQSISAILNNHQEYDSSFSNELMGKNILIVDDDSRNIFTLTSTLELTGAEVYSAFNGQEALDMLSSEDSKIDLILMDIMMPVMDGLVAIQNIKSNESYKNIPIIAITAKTMPQDKQECLDAGADEYLAKPIEQNALFAMIKAWIR
ncbi:MAG: ATP-binding protein [Sulfurimonas sp.]|nr:ATP-binding protein [Sulfurimonas sp.]